MDSFFQTWELFWQTYATGWLAAALLAVCGIVVVLKDQIFLGASVAQASTVGVASALWLAAGLHLMREDPAYFWILEGGAALFASGSAVLAPLLAGRLGLRLTMESVNGWVFLISSALSIILVSSAPFGLTEVQQILSAGLLGSQTREILLFSALLLITMLVVAFFGQRILISILDPGFARSLRIRAFRVELLAFLWVGIVVGLSLRIAGLVFTFGYLVLPAMASRELSRSPLQLLITTPALALCASIIGFYSASWLDVPMTHMAVLVIAVFALVSFLGRRFKTGTRMS